MSFFSKYSQTIKGWETLLQDLAIKEEYFVHVLNNYSIIVLGESDN